MEECDSSRLPPNTGTCMIRKQNDSIKPAAIIRAFINESESFSFSINDATGQRQIKSIILNKRRQQSNNAQGIETLQPSTDNEEDFCSNLSRSVAMKIENSHIIKDFKVLHDFFTFQAGFALLFRASDHHFSVQKFHELCDYQTNTLILCKTKCNQIIGGYTPLNWAEDYDNSKTYFKTDRENQTFLFSATKNQKYPLTKVKKNKAICCFRSWGPTFGGGYDLQIGNKADQSANSISHFPRSFVCKNKTASQKYFTGSKNRQFKILQWEVYKVIKKPTEVQANQVKPEVKQKGIINIIKKGIDNIFFSTKK